MAGKRVESRRMKALRDAFFAEGKRQAESDDPVEWAKSVCWICKGEIDYVAAPHTTPDSHNLDHYHTVDDRPDLQEDPDNFRHSHQRCNQHRGNRAPSPGLGEPVPDWW